MHLKHLHNVGTRLYCRQTFLSLGFQCRDDVSEVKQTFLGLKRADIAACTAGSQPLSGHGPAATTALPHGFGSMDTTVSYSDKPGRHILQEFLRKVLKLAANRSHDLCSRLDLEDANREDIETQVQPHAHCLLLLLAMLFCSSVSVHPCLVSVHLL